MFLSKNLKFLPPSENFLVKLSIASLYRDAHFKKAFLHPRYQDQFYVFPILLSNYHLQTVKYQIARKDKDDPVARLAFLNLFFSVNVTVMSRDVSMSNTGFSFKIS